MDSVLPRVHACTFSLSVVTDPTVVTVRIGGEIDVSTVDNLGAALAAVELDAADSVHLDLERLAFCDSAAADLLLDFVRTATRAGRRTTVCAARPTIRRLLVLLADGDPPTFR